MWQKHFPSINLSHLKYFCDAVELSSISEAAKKNFISQSAVSQAIRKLEICLDVSLAIHSKQKFSTTKEGALVFEHARQIFRSVQLIYDKIHESHEDVKGNIQFVSTHSIGISLIAPAYKRMQVDLPHVTIRYQLGGLPFIRSSLKQGSAEFALVVYDSSFAAFNKHVIKKGYFHLYSTPSAPESILDQGILVDYASGMFVDPLLQELKGALKIQTELAAWEVVARFAELNIGAGFLPDYIPEKRYPTLEKYPLEIPPFEYEISAIFNKGEKLSRAAFAFLEQFV